MTIQFDDNVPIPATSAGPKGRSKFADMMPGQSFFRPFRDLNGPNNTTNWHRDVCAVATLSRAHKWKIATRTVAEAVDGAVVRGIRVWRVE